MVNNKMLLDVIHYNNFTVKEMALILNLSEKDFRKKLQTGIFQTNEVECMLHFLKFPMNPMKIFFDTYNYEDPKKIAWWEFYRKTDDGKRAISEYLHRP